MPGEKMDFPSFDILRSGYLFKREELLKQKLVLM